MKPDRHQGVAHYVWVFTDRQHVVFRVTEHERPTSFAGSGRLQGRVGQRLFPATTASVPAAEVTSSTSSATSTTTSGRRPSKRTGAFAAGQSFSYQSWKRWTLRAETRHLRKFEDVVGSTKNITEEYASESVRTYQKRFERYRNNLFTFLTQDGIPWRTTWPRGDPATGRTEDLRLVHKRVVPHYLLLWPSRRHAASRQVIPQVPLVGADLDSFKRTKPIRYSYVLPDRGHPRNEVGGSPYRTVLRAMTRRIPCVRRSTLPPQLLRVSQRASAAGVASSSYRSRCDSPVMLNCCMPGSFCRSLWPRPPIVCRSTPPPVATRP